MAVPMPTPGPRFSRHLPSYVTVLAVDLERFTANPSASLTGLSEAVPRVLETAMRRSGLDWAERRFPQGTGDGYVLGLPVERTPLLLHPFLNELQCVLEEEAVRLRAEDPGARMRMRVSVHLGPLPDGGGEGAANGVGKPMNDAHRLLDCGPLRAALAAADPEVTLVAGIVSRRVYEDVVEAGYTALRPSELRRVDARVKRFAEPAWLYVPKPSWGAGANPDRHGAQPARNDQPAPSEQAVPSGPAGAVPPGPVVGQGTGNRMTTGSAGNVVQAGRVDNSSLTFVGGDARPQVRPVPAAQLDVARERYAEAPGAARARSLLRALHLVVLVGDPGGRRTTALRLLDELSLENGISLFDVLKHWDRPSVAALPLHSGCGYVLDLNAPDADRPGAEFAEDLRTHASRLVDHGSYLAVVARPEVWRECRALTGPYLVDLGRPAPQAVLEAHLRALRGRTASGAAGLGGAAGAQAAPPAGTLPPDLSPGDAAALAERIAGGAPVELPAGPRARVYLRVLDPDGRESDYTLRDGSVRRDEVRIGRPFPGETPDIAVDSDLVHRDHCRLVRDDGAWWLVPRGRNRPLLLRRGAAEPEPVDARVRVRDGDAVHVRVRPVREGRPRDWRLIFNDPHHTDTTRS
ncbi:FHA domain-containing protein [Actinomadura yumaensis]|uniref:FHA domain-containing protein n=1 Tax=Actinomadura yumaensis TaxID=111807 RepID=A0ABW2CN69_9ACTN